jgi:predicted secreted Zn-dependent protease
VRAVALLGTISALVLVEPQPQSPLDLCPVSPEFSYYDVHGITIDEVQESLRTQGPLDDRGHRRFAYTDWSIKWEWKRTERNKVDLRSLQISCSAEIQLPRLVIKKETPLALIRAWNSFVERTRRHELAHLRHAEAGAPRIRDRLEQVVALRGPLSPVEANEGVSAVVAEIRAMDKEYDQRTNHGFTEGTWVIE